MQLVHIVLHVQQALTTMRALVLLHWTVRHAITRLVLRNVVSRLVTMEADFRGVLCDGDVITWTRTSRHRHGLQRKESLHCPIHHKHDAECITFAVRIRIKRHAPRRPSFPRIPPYDANTRLAIISGHVLLLYHLNGVKASIA